MNLFRRIINSHSTTPDIANIVNDPQLSYDFIIQVLKNIENKTRGFNDCKIVKVSNRYTILYDSSKGEEIANQIKACIMNLTDIAISNEDDQYMWLIHNFIVISKSSITPTRILDFHKDPKLLSLWLELIKKLLDLFAFYSDSEYQNENQIIKSFFIGYVTNIFEEGQSFKDAFLDIINNLSDSDLKDKVFTLFGKGGLNWL